MREQGDGMDAYLVFKFLHVLAAMAWIGGGVTLAVMGIMADRRRDEAEVVRIINSVGLLGVRWFMPSALLTLVLGIVVTTLGGLWGELWVVLGLVGFAATFVTGHFVLRPQAEAAARLAREGHVSEAAGAGRKLLRVSKFDYTMLILVVADMVLKPVWTDYATLAAMAVVLVAGALAFLGPQHTHGSALPA